MLKKTNRDIFFRSIDRLVNSLDDMLFPLKSFKVFPSFSTNSCDCITYPYMLYTSLTRDRVAHIHKLNFFLFFLFGDLSFARLLKIRAKYLEKTILSVKETASVERHSR